MAKLEPSKKDQWSRPMRDTMATWLRGQDNITYTEKVRRLLLAGVAAGFGCCPGIWRHDAYSCWQLPARRAVAASLDSSNSMFALLADLLTNGFLVCLFVVVTGHGLVRQLG
jgi:hypothetical protein